MSADVLSGSPFTEHTIESAPPRARRFLTATRDQLGYLPAAMARLAASPTKSLHMIKWLVNRSFESSRHTAFEDEAVAQEMLTNTFDFNEGLDAFRERRSPDFRGW